MNKPDIHTAILPAFINFLKLFRNLTNDDIAIIEDHVDCRAVPEGDYLLPNGSICREMYFICKGVLRIVVQNEKGQDVTYHFLKENQFCTILESFTNGNPAREGIQAACDAEVVVFGRQKLNDLYKKLPWLEDIIDQVIRQGLLLKVQNRNAYLGEDAAARYRLFLIRQPDIALRVSLTDIASYLGITPQSLSRIRKNMH
jgi:CRP-like cAMP-binding protein